MVARLRSYCCWALLEHGAADNARDPDRFGVAPAAAAPTEARARRPAAPPPCRYVASMLQPPATAAASRRCYACRLWAPGLPAAERRHVGWQDLRSLLLAASPLLWAVQNDLRNTVSDLLKAQVLPLPCNGPVPLVSAHQSRLPVGSAECAARLARRACTTWSAQTRTATGRCTWRHAWASCRQATPGLGGAASGLGSVP